QGGDHADRAPQVVLEDVVVDGDPGDAAVGQGVHRPGHDAGRLEDVEGDHRLEGVQLQLPALGGEGHGEVVADHLEGDLVDDLRDHGVHLARHDRAARLHRGEVDLVETGSGPGGQQAQVVADLGDLHRDAAEDPREGHERPGVAGGLDQIGREHEIDAGQRGELLGGALGVAGIGGDAGADRGRPEVDLLEGGRRAGEALDVLLDGGGPGVELL